MQKTKYLKTNQLDLLAKYYRFGQILGNIKLLFLLYGCKLKF